MFLALHTFGTVPVKELPYKNLEVRDIGGAEQQQQQQQWWCQKWQYQLPSIREEGGDDIIMRGSHR